MDNGPLVMEEIEAGAQLIRQFATHQPLQAAFWLKLADESQRYLYLVPEGFQAADSRQAYGIVWQVANALQSPHLDRARIKVIGPDEALAREIIELTHQYPQTSATRIAGMRFDDTFADDVYIYSPLTPVATH